MGYFVLFLYLDAVLPREYGVPSHPLFFIKPLLNLCCGPAPLDDASSPLLGDRQEDPDIAKMRAMVERDQYSPNAPLVTKQLHKVLFLEFLVYSYAAVR